MPSLEFDRFDRNADTVSAPAREAFAIAPDDNAPLARLPKAILVGSAGSITLRAVDSDTDVVVVAAAGQIVPVRASHVRATGTDAANLVGLS